MKMVRTIFVILVSVLSNSILKQFMIEPIKQHITQDRRARVKSEEVEEKQNGAEHRVQRPVQARARDARHHYGTYIHTRSLYDLLYTHSPSLSLYIAQFQVLEDARGQFKLADTLQCQLLHRKRPVDLSIPFRLTGISNNALLELQLLQGSAVDAPAQQVRVCVQLADGKRVQSSFTSDTTIESILTFFKLVPTVQEVRSVLLCGYLRRVILMYDMDVFW